MYRLTVWLWRLYLLIAITVIDMGRPHLEHQLIRFKQNKYGNATTSKYDPYANYDPQEGVTTAVILGTTFMLVIAYIAFKMGWEKLRKRICYKNQKDGTQSWQGLDSEKQDVPELNLQRQCIPIIVQDENGCSAQASDYGSTRLEPGVDLTIPAIHTPSQAVHQLLTSDNPPTAQLDSFTMLVTENIPNIKQNSTKSQSNKNRTGKRSISSQSAELKTDHHQLPPAGNQVLRTAHWVNTVTNENQHTERLSPQQNNSKYAHEFDLSSTTQAEINHKKSPISSNKSFNPSGDNIASRRTVDLATSEV